MALLLHLLVGTLRKQYCKNNLTKLAALNDKTIMNWIITIAETNSAMLKEFELWHFGDFGILNIKKDICISRCPTGATDNRLARLVSHKIAVTFGRVGGYFCVLLLSLLPLAYPRPKQIRHKLLCNRKVTIPPKRANRHSNDLPQSIHLILLSTKYMKKSNGFHFATKFMAYFLNTNILILLIFSMRRRIS